MGQEQVLEVFLENPGEKFHIRGIARMLKISKTAANYHINNLLKRKIIIKEKKDVFPSFKANETSEEYRFFKQQAGLRKIIESNLLDYLENEFSPKCIILFGSFAKAEYSAESDIDIFIQADEKIVNMEKYEKKLGHKISLLFEPQIERLSPQLFNNIANGMKLRGFFKAK
ncbi:MAG: hypothetical protein COS25_01870 [Candidatus Nealsonbacteria bacterium CG02_land_8_20_14_3_00_37_10]|uniref:Polymerase beta nucleotidyltransferase domain-containing protein n=1 Tax=Candidatus Nealsonbacteria bacterium CG02_land_8_20_14_3_00_37_10 TaxID=1974699 RepID=A0A2M7D9F7_9BACT|nr:MAG: hypothetical protein COS25_01870 [Candidatus Nealsonbacteria bacterium CG02_land_8_20_14_3_00_37_10]